MIEPPAPRAWQRLRTHGPEAAVEGFTMTLYVSLSLLAVVVAMPSTPSDEAVGELVKLLLLTCLGLVLAHLVAFRLSARMVHNGQLPPESPEIILAQVVGGLAVAVLASVPVLIFGVGLGGAISGALLLGIVALAGWTVGTKAGLTTMRKIAYVTGVILLVVVVLAVKAAAGH